MVGCSGEIMASRDWSWLVAAKFWLVVGGGGEIMAGHRWSWVVAVKLWLAVGGCGKSWVVVDGRGWSHDLVILIAKPFFHNFYAKFTGKHLRLSRFFNKVVG